MVGLEGSPEQVAAAPEGIDARVRDGQPLVFDQEFDAAFSGAASAIIRALSRLALAWPGLHLVELTRPILVESCRLPPPFHGDPADQIIVATARDRDAAIITKDEKIRAYAHVRSVW